MTDIPRKVILPDLTKDEIKIINNLFFHSDQLLNVEQLDILIIFGVSNQLIDCTNFIKSLLKYKLKATLIISGGVIKPGTNLSESKLIYNVIKNNLNDIKVILENKSTNTYENVTFSLAKINLDKIEKIGIVNSTLNSFRAYLTTKKYLENLSTQIFRFSYPYVNHKKNSKKLTKTSWYQDEEFKQQIASELTRIITYGNKNDLDYNYFKKIVPKNLINKLLNLQT